MYLTLPNFEPFWLCFNIRSTAIQCLQFVYRPFFLNIPFPYYIFIKQMSLFVLGRGISTYNFMFYMIGRRLDNSILTRFMHTHTFFFFVANAVVLFVVDVLTRVYVVLIGNYKKKIFSHFPFH